MKIIHTADWHIGQTFFGYDRTEEHQAFFDWLSTQIKEQEIDALLIAGDIFDVANPSAQAQKQFYRFMKNITTDNPGLQIVVIAGNHDSATRLETPVPLLEGLDIHIRGGIKRDETGRIDTEDLIINLHERKGNGRVWCMAIPYLRQGDYPPPETQDSSYAAGIKNMYETVYREIGQRKAPEDAIIAMGHLQAANCALSEDDGSERLLIGGLEGIPADTFNPGITYTALGHIHREQRVGKRENVRYSGSPLPMSFAEENYRHGVILLEIGNGKLLQQEKLTFSPLARLLRIPQKPKPLTEVMQELAALPSLSPGEPSPYLEVRVLLNGPEPSLRHQIEEAVEQKQVRLTRVVPFYPSANIAGTNGDPASERLMEPLEMVQAVYRQKYNTELPENLTKLFIEALQESYRKTESRS